jgi:hypothetical protein
MNIQQQADYVIWSTLQGDDYAVALRFVEYCKKVSSLHGTPIDELMQIVNTKLAADVSRGQYIDT